MSFDRSNPPIFAPTHASQAEPIPLVRVQYHGKTVSFISLLLKNLTLTALSFGLYYPWAKTNLRKYIWQNAEINGQRIEYTGTGQEIFTGYLRVYGTYLVLAYGVQKCAQFVPHEIVPILKISLSAFVAVIVPLLIFNSLRYLSARTRYRGVHLNLLGGKSDYISASLLGIIACVFTFGLYYPIMKNNQRRIIFENLRYGNISFRYFGKNNETFKLFTTGLFLSLITFGFYSFQAIAKYKNYIFSNITLDRARLNLELTWQDVFVLIVGFSVIAICTLGLGLPWYKMMALERITSRLTIQGRIDLRKLKIRRDRSSAASDSAVDAFDVDTGVA